MRHVSSRPSVALHENSHSPMLPLISERPVKPPMHFGFDATSETGALSDGHAPCSAAFPYAYGRVPPALHAENHSLRDGFARSESELFAPCVPMRPHSRLPTHRQ